MPGILNNWNNTNNVGRDRVSRKAYIAEPVHQEIRATGKKLFQSPAEQTEREKVSRKAYIAEPVHQEIKATGKKLFQSPVEQTEREKVSRKAYIAEPVQKIKATGKKLFQSPAEQTEREKVSRKAYIAEPVHQEIKAVRKADVYWREGLRATNVLARKTVKSIHPSSAEMSPHRGSDDNSISVNEGTPGPVRSHSPEEELSPRLQLPVPVPYLPRGALFSSNNKSTPVAVKRAGSMRLSTSSTKFSKVAPTRAALLKK